MLHADGTERTVELTPVQITVGGATIFTGFLRDLTEIERSHAALADQTERLNCLIAAAMPGILITDEQGTVTNISQSFGAMFGLDEPDRPGRHVRAGRSCAASGTCSSTPPRSTGGPRRWPAPGSR